jgi:hypothetical protein
LVRDLVATRWLPAADLQRFCHESVILSGSDWMRRTVMLRKTVIALMATAAVAMLVPDIASAQRGFGDGRNGGRRRGAAAGAVAERVRYLMP